MTIASDISRVDLVGDGANDTFAFTFEIYAKTDILVYVDNVLKTVDVDYTVPVGGIDNPDGGNVVFTAGNKPADGAIVSIILNLPFTQLIDYIEAGKFPAETHERGLDRVVRLLQQLRERADRHLELSASSSYSDLTLPDPVASQYLAWKDDLSGIKNVEVQTTGELTITDFMKTIADDADAGEALTTLGVSAFIQTLLNDADAATAQTTLGISAFIKALLDDTTVLEAIGTLNLEPYVRNQRAIFTYNGGATAYTVKAKHGRYVCKDKYCWWNADITTDAIAAPGADDWYYLYLDYSAITSGTEITATELIWSNTEPAWNDTYGAWMNGDDLCIFAARTNGGPTNILEFFHDGDLVIFADHIITLDAVDVDTTWTDAAQVIPAFTQKALVTMVAHYVDQDTQLYWRTNGQTGTTGHVVGKPTSGTVDNIITTSVITDSDGKIEVKFADAGGDTVYVYTNGWHFPIGM